jgi:hypothetical protein
MPPPIVAAGHRKARRAPPHSGRLCCVAPARRVASRWGSQTEADPFAAAGSPRRGVAAPRLHGRPRRIRLWPNGRGCSGWGIVKYVLANALPSSRFEGDRARRRNSRSSADPNGQWPAPSAGDRRTAGRCVFRDCPLSPNPKAGCCAPMAPDRPARSRSRAPRRPRHERKTDAMWADRAISPLKPIHLCQCALWSCGFSGMLNG